MALSVISQCRFSHIESLAPSCFPRPTLHATPWKMFSGPLCMQRYKILQAIARLSRIFLWPIRPALFFKHKIGNGDDGENKYSSRTEKMATTTEIKNHLEKKWRRRRRRFQFLSIVVFLFSCSSSLFLGRLTDWLSRFSFVNLFKLLFDISFFAERLKDFNRLER